jgi:predicted O-methyltransferase YrrM
LCQTEIDKAIRRIRRGDTDGGLTALTVLVGHPESAPVALGHRAWLHRSMGRFPEAIKDYRDLLDRKPSDHHARALLAETLLMTGEADAAFETAMEALLGDRCQTLAAQVLVRLQATAGGDGPIGAQRLPPDPNDVGGEDVNTLVKLLESAPTHFIGSIHPHIARLIYWIVRCRRPSLAIETGSYIGYSSLVIAAALKAAGHGHLHAFDWFRRPAEEHPLADSLDGEDLLAKVRAQAIRAGLAEFVTYHRGDSSQSIETLARERPLQAELAFIDGDHQIKGCMKDWLAVDRHLEPGGLIVLHDTLPETCNWLGPRYLLEELDKRNPDAYGIVNLFTHDGAGLGLLQKRHSRKNAAWLPPLKTLLTDWIFTRLKWPR